MMAGRFSLRGDPSRRSRTEPPGLFPILTGLFAIVTAWLILSLFLLPAALAAPLAERSVRPNGLVLLHSARHGLPIVRVALGIRAGSLEEPAEKAGLASMTAAVITEGTGARSAREIRKEIEFVGGSLGASASNDFATISLTVLKKDVELGFTLLADVLKNPAFPAAEVERVRERILGGIQRKREEPGVVAEEAFLERVFGEHPYGRPTEGTEKTVPGISRDDIQAFHRDHYTPNRSWMAVVGDLTTGELDGLLKRHLGDWHKGSDPNRVLPGPPQPQAVTVVLDRDLTQANIRVGHVGLRRNHPDYYAASVMNYILGGGGFSSRLMDTIRDDMGLAYSVYSSFNPGLDTGYFVASVETKNESAGTVLAEIDRQIEKIRTAPVTDAELADAKSYLIGSFPRRLDSTAKIARFLVAVEFYGLGLDYPDRYPEIIGKITPEEILRVAKKHLHPGKLTRIVVGRESNLSLD